MSCFKVALIGYGLAGAAFHAPLIAATSGLRLAAIVTSDEGRRARARLEHPDAVLLARADEIWARSGDYDLVVVAAPNRAHVPLALAALDAGLHVVVDKPFAPTAEGARLVVERARKLGLIWSTRRCSSSAPSTTSTARSNVADRARRWMTMCSSRSGTPQAFTRTFG